MNKSNFIHNMNAHDDKTRKAIIIQHRRRMDARINISKNITKMVLGQTRYISNKISEDALNILKEGR